MRLVLFTAVVLGLPAASVAQDLEIHVGWEGERPPYWTGWTVEERHEYEVRIDGARVEFRAWIETWSGAHPDRPVDPVQAEELFVRSVNAGFAVGPSVELVQGVVEAGLPREVAVEVVRTTAESGFRLVEDEWRADPASFAPAEIEGEHRNLGQWVRTQVHGGLRGRALAEAIHERVRERKDQRKKEKGDHGHGHGHGPGKGKGKGNKD